MPSATESFIEIVFAGQRLWLDAAGALYWPQQRLLIVSDLHLEKGSFFAQFGSLLPTHDTQDTLMRLAERVEHYQPRAVVCLGDSFHDRKALERLQRKDRSVLLELIAKVQEWHWIVGNHDAQMPLTLPGEAQAQLHIEGITLLHEPSPVSGPQIIGHFHPKLHMKMQGAKVSGKVFAQDHRYLLMPAFGSYTGGLDVLSPTLTQLLDSPRYYMLYRNRIWKV